MIKTRKKISITDEDLDIILRPKSIRQIQTDHMDQSNSLTNTSRFVKTATHLPATPLKQVQAFSSLSSQ